MLKPKKPTPNAFKEIWGIYNDALKPVFDVDSCLDLDFKDEAKVSMFPVENGSFANYNKVREPFSITLRLSVGGNSQRIQTFLNALLTAKGATTLYNVFTPEIYQPNMTISGYRYKRSQEHGKNQIIADISMVEIRQVAPSYASTAITAGKAKKVAATSPTNTGKTQPGMYEDNVLKGKASLGSADAAAAATGTANNAKVQKMLKFIHGGGVG